MVKIAICEKVFCGKNFSQIYTDVARRFTQIYSEYERLKTWRKRFATNFTNWHYYERRNII